MRENGGAQFRTRWTKKRLSSGVSAKSGERDLFTIFSTSRQILAKRYSSAKFALIPGKYQ